MGGRDPLYSNSRERTMRASLLMPAILAIATAFVLAGCQSSGVGCGDCAGALPPTNLPPSPDPCATYCKEYVAPVTRKVPKLVKLASCGWKESQVCVHEVSYDDVVTKPATCGCAKKTCGTTCNESLVMIKPGGYRWLQNQDGCWKYEYCKPEYKWCERTTKEEGIEYCYDTPAEYETVARTRKVMKTRREYVPAKYGIKYVDEVYQPGHYRWRASVDCSPCQKPLCECAPRGAKTVKIMESCERCN